MAFGTVSERLLLGPNIGDVKERTVHFGDGAQVPRCLPEVQQNTFDRETEIG